MIKGVKQFVVREKTVDSILNTFTKAVGDLNDRAITLEDKWGKHNAEVTRLKDEMRQYESEKAKAIRIADKLASLIEG